MRKIVFATNNAHKIEEVRAIAGDRLEILSLADIDCHADIPETADTLEGNAVMKAEYVKRHFGIDCFADDSGLEVEALGGEPGVRSARYATEGHDNKANMAKLLRKLEGADNRKARFRTVIALILDGETHLFEGVVEGSITTDERGTGGFGYDPVFLPASCEQTFAEMGEDAKNKISHRAKAVALLMDFLKAKGL